MPCSNMQSLSPSEDMLSSPYLTPHKTPRASRSSRSLSSCSTASTVSSASSSPRDSYISHSPAPPASFYPSSLDAILAQASTASFQSLTSVSLQSIRSERKPASYNILDAREEKSMYGDVMSVLEPRNCVGWWGVGEVLEGEA